MSNRIPIQCADHAWCWGACEFPEDGRTEHRTHFRILEPAREREEPRRDYRKHVATGVAQVDDGAPLVVLNVSTSRRSIEVRLTFSELLRLQCDLANAGVHLAAAMAEGDTLVRCPRCRQTFHPEALGGRGRPCRDCGGPVIEVAREGRTGGAEGPDSSVDSDAWGVPKVECRDCDSSFHPDSSPHADRCCGCAARVDGEVSV